MFQIEKQIGFIAFCSGHRNLAYLVADKHASDSTIELHVDGQLTSVLRAAGVVHTPLSDTNQIIDSGFSRGLGCWRANFQTNAGVTFGIDVSPNWTLSGGHTAYLAESTQSSQYQKVEISYFEPLNEGYLLIKGASQCRVSGYFGMHRCEGALVAEFFDTTKQLLGCHEISLPEGSIGGQNLRDYLKVEETITPPIGAEYCALKIRKYSTKEGADSYLFFTRLFFAQTSPSNETILWHDCPWSPEELHFFGTASFPPLLKFAFSLPYEVYDGRSHDISLRERNTGRTLFGSPCKFCCSDRIEGEVERIEGSTLVGWARNSTLNAIAPLEVELWIDGYCRAKGATELPHEKMKNSGFVIAIPTEFLDGRPHSLEVRHSPSGQLIGGLTEMMPYVLTPWDAIERFSAPPIPAQLSPASAFRYESMRRHLNALSRASVAGTWEQMQHISQLGRLHERLVQGFFGAQTKNFPPVEFLPVVSPTVSVVIPVHNNVRVTYNCLVALIFAHNSVSFEVILVDDGSTDQTKELPDIVKGIHYIRSAYSEGFVRSCNRGGDSATGKYIVLLNNDTEPTAGWLDEMVYVFENFDQVGMVGSKLLYPDGRLQEAGGIVWSSGNPWNYGRNGNAQHPSYNYMRQVDYLSGASIMMPAKVWGEVGGFSEEFCPAYFEDTDLAFKVREKGYKTVYSPLSIVYHFEGVSSGTSVASGIKRYQEINRPKFKHKWAKAYRYNGEEGKSVEINKDRGVCRRALVIDYQTPRPDKDAGSYAAIQEMRLLQSLGCKVTFLPENFAYLGSYTVDLQRNAIEVLYAPFYNSVKEVLEKRGGEFDIVYITRYYVAQAHLGLVRQYAPRAKVLFCNADLHFLRQIRDAIQREDQVAMKEALKVREMELAIMRKVDVTLSYNSAEHAVIASHNGSETKVVTCPWVVDCVDNTPTWDQRSGVAFLGGFGHPPNIQAVLFFVKEVMPILRRRMPGVIFHVYGSNVKGEIAELSSEDVFIEGYVESVDTVYHNCRVFVAPLLDGAGIKGKVIEGLAHGTPMVLSRVAAEGTTLRHGLEVMIAETVADWVDAITAIYTDSVLWGRIAKSAREYAREQYSFRQGQILMRKALETVDIFSIDDKQALVVNRARVGRPSSVSVRGEEVDEDRKASASVAANLPGA